MNINAVIQSRYNNDPLNSYKLYILSSGCSTLVLSQVQMVVIESGEYYVAPLINDSVAIIKVLEWHGASILVQYFKSAPVGRYTHSGRIFRTWGEAEEMNPRNLIQKITPPTLPRRSCGDVVIFKNLPDKMNIR